MPVLPPPFVLLVAVHVAPPVNVMLVILQNVIAFVPAESDHVAVPLVERMTTRLPDVPLMLTALIVLVVAFGHLVFAFGSSVRDAIVFAPVKVKVAAPEAPRTRTLL